MRRVTERHRGSGPGPPGSGTPDPYMGRPHVAWAGGPGPRGRGAGCRGTRRCCVGARRAAPGPRHQARGDHVDGWITSTGASSRHMPSRARSRMQAVFPRPFGLAGRARSPRVGHGRVTAPEGVCSFSHGRDGTARTLRPDSLGPVASRHGAGDPGRTTPTSPDRAGSVPGPSVRLGCWPEGDARPTVVRRLVAFFRGGETR